MSTKYGNRVVTDGLLMCVDAGNSRSIVNGATAWNDLTYKNNGGILTNSPTFNNGSITFDGISDYIDTSLSPEVI